MPVWRHWASRRRRSGLAVEVSERDGVDLQLRVGLNSGQVIAGEIGSGALGYTAIGEQVGMAQRMESVAPPGGVMLSASTARLVEGAAALGEPEMVRIKGADEPVAARRLLGMGDGHRAVGRAESNLVGRRWELSAVEGLLERAIDGHGAVVGVVGPPGIGKSRLVREVAAMAVDRGVEVFTAFCESHTSQTPLPCRRAAAARRHRCRAILTRRPPAIGCATGFRTQTPRTWLLFDDLLGIADPEVRAAEDRSGCASAAVDRAGQCRLVGPRTPRRSMSLRTRTGSMRSASRCWPSSSR